MGLIIPRTEMESAVRRILKLWVTSIDRGVGPDNDAGCFYEPVVITEILDERVRYRLTVTIAATIEWIPRVTVSSATEQKERDNC